jgi:predicted amidohydrolase
MTGPQNDRTDLSRRQVLKSLGAAAGTFAIAANTQAAEPPASSTSRRVPCTIRVAAVSFAMPFHPHRQQGVNLAAMRDMTAKVARERPDFVCYPEACACVGNGFEAGVASAPELEPYVAEVGKIAREFKTAIVAPFLEYKEGRVYNSVPIVDRTGKLVLVYHKNYPTIGELEAGITPGTEVPVGECDGVRVGAAVCFDANFDNIPAELERQRARLVFWPSMYWGGRLLEHWALRYGFAMALAYNSECTIIDMNGRSLIKQGADTYQVRNGRLPPWAVADIAINRELYHLDENQKHIAAIREKYAPDVEVEITDPEGFFLLSSKREDLPVEDVAAEFGLETLRDYLARSVKLRNERVTA